MKQLATLILLLSSLTAAHAETRWVSDQLVITLRTGQGNQYQILKTLPSGTKLEVLNQINELDENVVNVSSHENIKGILEQCVSEKKTVVFETLNKTRQGEYGQISRHMNRDGLLHVQAGIVVVFRTYRDR